MVANSLEGTAHIQAALVERGKAWAEAGRCAGTVAALARICTRSLKEGGQVIFCGNGGSASQADHLAAELVGRYLSDARGPLSSRALSTTGALVTAIGNDYGYDEIFARQVDGVARRGDVLIALSTSGSSPNIRLALEAGRRRECVTALFTGDREPAELPPAEHLVAVPSSSTPVIQELHLFFGHLLCELIEAEVLSASK